MSKQVQKDQEQSVHAVACWQGEGMQGAMALPAKDFRGHKTCKNGRQMHEMKQERYQLSKVFSGAPSRNVNVALNCVAWKSLGP